MINMVSKLKCCLNCNFLMFKWIPPSCVMIIGLSFKLNSQTSVIIIGLRHSCLHILCLINSPWSANYWSGRVCIVQYCTTVLICIDQRLLIYINIYMMDPSTSWFREAILNMGIYGGYLGRETILSMGPCRDNYGVHNWLKCYCLTFPGNTSFFYTESDFLTSHLIFMIWKTFQYCEILPLLCC